MLLIGHPIFAQTKITGQIFDDKEQPLMGVTIGVRGGQIKVTSNESGIFEIESTTLPTTLVFSNVGFETLEYSVSTGENDLKIHLKPSDTNIDEVVVVGYGTQSRKSLTTAISKVDGKSLEDIPISTVGEGLRGKIAGARVYQSNNSPGADAVFRIRGGSSINKTNDPLVLVDGVERSFSGVNPNDVESIEVLKDAASTAIYGSRASNGVVLITTKKGKDIGGSRITFDANYAFQTPESLIL